MFLDSLPLRHQGNLKEHFSPVVCTEMPSLELTMVLLCGCLSPEEDDGGKKFWKAISL